MQTCLIPILNPDVVAPSIQLSGIRVLYRHGSRSMPYIAMETGIHGMSPVIWSRDTQRTRALKHPSREKTRLLRSITRTCGRLAMGVTCTGTARAPAVATVACRSAPPPSMLVRAARDQPARCFFAVSSPGAPHGLSPSTCRDS